MADQLPKQVSDLIERFERNQQSYTSSQYNEAQLRQEFINPFFEALGWDVSNIQGNAEAYKDVIHEDAIKIGSAVKAPDYCFRVGGTRKFFVEAKKPFVKIDDNSDAAFQLRRYAWSAKLPLGILTNFKEFAVYDCRIDPVKDDKASTARISYFIYKDYPQQWDYLASVFSKESVFKGSFDKYAESSKLKRGTATVDEKFLKEIESWRSELAHKIAIRNTKLTTRELNFAVQRTIDRIIFLRICEDRGMEQYGKLQSMMNGVNVYKRLFELFQRADQRYNSGLFHFSKERDRKEEPDNLTPFLNIDDEPIKDIINRLYYPESPYEFSVLSADILGQVYEQFLGKVIRLTEGHHAKIEEKPEVRKAGGIYYTPTYIVDYIVKNTVGRLLGQEPDLARHSREGGNPASSPVVIPAKAGIQSPDSFPPLTGGTEGRVKKPINPKDASKLRILDPACGSGSFLIGAYQYLLDWHLDWYVKDGAEKYAKAARPILYQVQGGSYRLTTYERKRILLNNIYGVDIDPQAVEVTKLSLLLKVLEGESSQTLDVQFKLFHERALPDLENNIKCGNSLIGPDFYQQQSLNLFNDDARLRINAFDWNTEFKDIMTSGGFDAVIGNPPYGATFSKNEAIYFQDRYKVFSGVKDVYVCFIERSLSMLNTRGRHSFIVPSAWLGGPEYTRLRNLFLQYQIELIILLPFDVFKDAYVDTTVFVISNQFVKPEHTVQTNIFPKREKLVTIKLAEDRYQAIHQSEWVNSADNKFVLDSNTVRLLEQIRKQVHATFADVIEIKRGVLFDKNLLTKKKTGVNSYRYFEGDVYRYQLNLITEHWIEFNDMIKERPKEFIWFEEPRILMRRLVNRRQRMMSSLATDTFITNKNLYSVLSKDKLLSIEALLGVLNSRLISYLYINQVTQATKDDFPQVTIKDVLALPFPQLLKDKARHDKMVSLVDQMLSLNKQLPTVKTDHEKTALQRQIDTIDKQIDELVYELYGITEEERKIIEGNGIANDNE